MDWSGEAASKKGMATKREKRRKRKANEIVAGGDDVGGE
jgi:hypothetical protein